MKIQIDTDNKTVTIEEDVLLHIFYEQINSLLPGGLWREYTLKVTKITEWINPITIDRPYTPDVIPMTTPNTTPYPGIQPIWYKSPHTTSGVHNLNIKY
jgi:hypothetical protein